MGLFGGSSNKTNQTSVQYGASEGSVLVGEGATYNNEFSDNVATTLGHALDLLGSAVGSAFDNSRSLLDQSQQAVGVLGTVAAREKTPLSEWLPIIAIGGTVAVAIFYFRKKG